MGTVLGYSNAKVAATLGLDVVLVANGGVGSTFDELALNVMACRAENVHVKGVIINKCVPVRCAEVSRYLQLASSRHGWNLPVLACVPAAESLTAKMSADNQSATRDVIDHYSPHLEQCVMHLFSDEPPRLQRDAGVPALEQLPTATRRQTIWPRALQREWYRFGGLHACM